MYAPVFPIRSIYAREKGGVFLRKYVGCCYRKFWYRDLRGSGRTVYVGRKRDIYTG